MKIETQLDSKSYIRLMYQLTFRKPTTIIFSVLGAIMFVGSIYLFIYTDDEVNSLVISFVFGFYTLTLPIQVYRNAKKNFNSHLRLQEKMTYEFTDEKIIVTGDSFQSEQDWLKMYKVLEIKDWILLYQNKQIANLIPTASFGNELEAFRALVKSKNIKSKLR